MVRFVFHPLLPSLLFYQGVPGVRVTTRPLSWQCALISLRIRWVCSTMSVLGAPKAYDLSGESPVPSCSLENVGLEPDNIAAII